MKAYAGLLVCMFLAVNAADDTCTWSRTDITVLIDMKKSLGDEAHVATAKPFLYAMIMKLKKELAGKSNSVRLSLVSYSGQLNIRHKLTQSQAEGDLLSAVQDLFFESGTMRTDQALKDCITKGCFATKDKANKNILIILTDGKNDNKGDIDKVIKQHYSNFEIFALGIGAQNNDDVLKAISGGDYENINVKCVYTEFAGRYVDILRKRQCPNPSTSKPPLPPQPPTTKPTLPTTTASSAEAGQVHSTEKPKITVAADIVFLIDGSRSLLPSQFDAERDFAKQLMSRLNGGVGGARFAALTFASEVKDVSDWNEALPVAMALDQAKFLEQGRTMTDLGINKAVTELFGSKYKARKEKTAKIIIIITDGAPTSKTQVTKAAQAAQKAGIEIVALVIGSDLMKEGSYNQKKLLSMVNGKKENIFTANSFDKMEPFINQMLDKLAKSA